MRKATTAHTVIHVLGMLILIQGVLLFLPLLFVLLYNEWNISYIFIFPSLSCFGIGFLLMKLFKQGKIYFVQSILICGSTWIVLSCFACLPFFLGKYASFLDAYFETVSGFTTTGITIFTNIEILPRSILFWRSLIQWLGGLGILTLFLAITAKSNNAYYHLFSAESHKISSSRPVPGIFNTVVILWGIYSLFTVCELIILRILGLSLFDALCHSLTTLSTGGFSTYNASIDYFRQAGYSHYKAIEYVISFFMFLGGMNFFLHYLLLSGRFLKVIKNTEFRYFILIIGLSVVFILIDRMRDIGVTWNMNQFEEDFRGALFTVVSIITTTGFGTIDINTTFFPALSKQILLLLMFVGGCVGSTAGGIKVMRLVILDKIFRMQIKRLRLPRNALARVVVDQEIFSVFEIKRITGLFLGWILLIVIGGGITAFFTRLDSWQSFSGMFSAMGNIGPCYFSVREMAALPGVVKLAYIFGMLAGRLEILPVLLLFSRKAWTS